MADSNVPIVTVSQVNRVVGMLIKGDKRLCNVAVRGEVSNFTKHYKTGHLYFTLKDEQSQLKAVMFAGNAARLDFLPKDGDKLVAHGNITVYEPSGVYQVNCTSLERDGAGEQAAALERLKKKLAAEGLFAQKRPLPAYPTKIAVVTSAGGAALQDIINIISRRYPVATLAVIPAAVQGEGAAMSVAEGLAKAQNVGADVIIFGRGGGSAEDLSAFDSETVARAVFASKIPTISAVGHETDFTVADLVADMRAPTPSAAAELAVPDIGVVYAAILGTFERIGNAARRRVSSAEQAVSVRAEMIKALSPQSRVAESERQLKSAQTLIREKMKAKIDGAESALKKHAEVISALNPLGVLARGYSVVRHGGRVLSSAAEVREGDDIEIRLNDGSLKAKVTEITDNAL